MANTKQLTLLCAYIVQIVRVRCSGLAVAAHENTKTELPSLTAVFRAPSMHVCLHKCALDELCNVACMQHVSPSHVTCSLQHSKDLSNLRHHLHAQSGFSVYVLPKRPVVGGAKTTATAYPECTGSARFYLQLGDNSMYVAVKDGRLILVSSRSEPICAVADDRKLYMVNEKKCILKAGSGIGIAGDCALGSADLQRVDGKIKSEVRCLQPQNLDSIVEGSELHFKIECNDSRLKFKEIASLID